MNVEWLLSSCVLIVFVVLVRFAFRKRIRPRLRYVLWLAVAVRLLLPFSFWGTAVSILNLLPERTADGAEAGLVPAGGQQEEQKRSGKEEDGFNGQAAEYGQAPNENSRFYSIADEIPESIPDDLFLDMSFGEAVRQDGEREEQISPRTVADAGVKADAGRLLWYIWLSGVCVCGITLLAVNGITAGD